MQLHFRNQLPLPTSNRICCQDSAGNLSWPFLFWVGWGGHNTRRFTTEVGSSACALSHHASCGKPANESPQVPRRACGALEPESIRSLRPAVDARRVLAHARYSLRAPVPTDLPHPKVCAHMCCRGDLTDPNIAVPVGQRLHVKENTPERLGTASHMLLTDCPRSHVSALRSASVLLLRPVRHCTAHRHSAHQDSYRHADLMVCEMTALSPVNFCGSLFVEGFIQRIDAGQGFVRTRCLAHSAESTQGTSRTALIDTVARQQMSLRSSQRTLGILSLSLTSETDKLAGTAAA